MIRSWLYVSGARPEQFAKALASEADAVVLDLEDSVPPREKAAARTKVVAFLQQGGGSRTFVRINALGTDAAEDDLAALTDVEVGGVRVPKVDRAAGLDRVAETFAHGARSVEIQPIIESAAGLVEVASVLASSATSRIVVGEADLMADLGVHDPDHLRPLYVDLVVASRAAGKLPPVQSVWIDLADDEGLARSTRMGRDMGFVGRSAIHPQQIGVIHDALKPDESELSRARAILSLLRAAEGEGQAAAVLPDGTFVDSAMIRAARGTLRASGELRDEDGHW